MIVWQSQCGRAALCVRPDHKERFAGFARGLFPVPQSSVLSVKGNPALSVLTSLNPVFFLLACAAVHIGTSTKNGGEEIPL